MRLDLAGGWTDVPPYSTRVGGVVVTASVELYAHAEVAPRDRGYRLVAQDLGVEAELAGPADLAGSDGMPLLRAGLRLLPPGPCALTTRADAPPGCGLGSSGAMDVALVAALSAARGESPDTRTVADLACRLEGIEAGIPGGRQDQFAAAFGGFLRLEFRDPGATVQPLVVGADLAAELARRMLLVYTGASRFSGATIGRVMSGYERGDRAISAALDGIREVAEAMPSALRAADFARMGELLSANWRLQQALDPAMCTAEMARLERAMREAGVLGGKAAGAGAGGSMFFLGPDDPAPAAAAARELGMRLLPVRWAMEGVRRC